jgi:hypothetical protein
LYLSNRLELDAAVRAIVAASGVPMSMFFQSNDVVEFVYLDLENPCGLIGGIDFKDLAIDR